MLKEQIIDVTRSFLVTDPEAFYENQMVSQREDSPEKMLPIVAYEGYNFLPTLYGYRSYFDVASKLDIGALASRCDRIVLYQFANYQNILVALCEDGIWTNSGGTAAEAWNHRVTLSIPGVGSYLEWTFCVIENTLYMYRQGGSLVYTVKPTSYALGNPVENFAPSFLNMSGQMGIFRANGRLGFWDSANSVSWSSLFSFSDFTPSVETLAGFATFNDILGRIVTIKSHGSGFIIYSTKNIVGVSYEATGSVLFSARTIAEVAGIWTSKQVCSGAVDTEQFAYTNTGIKHISAGFKIEDIFTGVYDFLKESREPVYMDFLNGRYLFLSLIDPDYISGKVSFVSTTVGSFTIRFLYNKEEVTDPEVIPELIEGVPLAEAITRDLVLNPGNYGLYAQWRSSGSKLIPSRISSMSPYELDDPFTPDDDYPYATNTAPLYTMDEIQAVTSSGSLPNKVSINNSTPSLLDLGWHNAPGGTGQLDSAFSRFLARQTREWDEYTTLANDAVTTINSIAETTPVHEYGAVIGLPITYDNSDLPTLETWVTAGTITHPTLDVTIDTIVTGVGTGTPTYTKTRTYHKQWLVETANRVLARTNHFVKGIFWITQGMGASNPYYVEGGEEPGVVSVIPSTGGRSVPDSLLASLGAAEILGPYQPGLCSDYIGRGEKSEAYNSALWYEGVSNVLASHTQLAHAELEYPPGLFGSGWIEKYDLISSEVVCDELYDYRLAYRYQWSRFDILTGTTYIHPSPIVLELIIKPYPFTTTNLACQSDITHSKRIRATTIEASSPLVSTLYATQENLDWGVWEEDNPNPDFPYAEPTLELTNPYLIYGSTLPNSLTVTYPGATFLLQNATTAPIYPDFAGALVYDLPLQKWGKAKCTYRCLMDYSPINSNVEQVVDYTNFGLTAGLLAADGFLRLFSANCTDSFIRYGKLAFSRIGYTYPEELVINFRMPFTGEIQTDVSMDGRSIHSSLEETTAFSGVGTAKVYPSYSGQWHTFAVKGNFDIRSISYTGRVSGIR